MALNNISGVTTIVTLDGKNIRYTNLVLEQGFNRHHTFSITLHHEALEPFWMSNSRQVFALAGKDVQITFVHKTTGEQNIFSGIVRRVTYAGKNGVHNNIILHGGSITLKMDGNPTMDSFTDRMLKMIVNDAVKHSGNGVEVVVKPIFDGKIDYLCQYGETCFNFLDRLSRMYGEWFYYDGRQIRFGKPDSLGMVDLVYDVHLRKIELSVQVVPHTVDMYEYLQQNGDKFETLVSPTEQETGGYAHIAFTRSGEFFPTEGMVPSRVPVSSRRELWKTVANNERMRAISEMLVVDGESDDCRVGIGKMVEISLPQTMKGDIRSVGEFLIGKVMHRADMVGNYSNTFTGYTKYAGCVPPEPASFPSAGPQLAVVADNADPEGKGRVKVKFHWQQDGYKSTNWIRVQTPDGGTSEAAGTRGFTFVPELNDQVMIGFEYNSPDRPYVMGSMFSMDVGKGGGDGNKCKSLVTRSGISISLDDGTGSVAIKDKNGADSMVTLDGEGNITITSKESITLNCGKSTITMNKEGDIGINGENLFAGGVTSVDLAAGVGVNGDGGDVSGFHADGNEVSAFSKGDANIAAEKNVSVFGKSDVTIAAKGELIARGESKIGIN